MCSYQCNFIVTKIKSRTRIIGLRFKKTRTRIIVVWLVYKIKTKTKINFRTKLSLVPTLLCEILGTFLTHTGQRPLLCASPCTSVTNAENVINTLSVTFMLNFSINPTRSAFMTPFVGSCMCYCELTQPGIAGEIATSLHYITCCKVLCSF